MKRVLITGKNSYVGNSFEKWVTDNYPEEFQIDKISLRTDEWKSVDFSIYDVVLHVAGIAHVSTDPSLREKYYRINRDLTMEIATKANLEGVKQFIFLSSIIVYGDSINNTGVIRERTIPKPSNYYGDSKLQAENGLKDLESKSFKIVIIRPPMIYGKNSKGNYPRLAKFATMSPVFPNFYNRRSMLHIDNLSEFIKLMIQNKECGLFFPQNKDYVQTSNMVEEIAKAHNKTIKTTKIFNPIINLLRNRLVLINKVFGDLYYERDLSNYKEDYIVHDLRSSIASTESRD
ncbi:NAD-dependent epimerase/dehydratase family protein [Gracilibacillus lacisalsi]|uniref:NAD-dependent epimerase/dehydratase family protein n=1 Tax=Gracilibacillus lacisalsi TaxID=393087 RepID=UPI00036D29FD|nr:NAD-dependent epimerase/dehydratase family protein [Gracilibacillus lacisalsi]